MSSDMSLQGFVVAVSFALVFFNSMHPLVVASQAVFVWKSLVTLLARVNFQMHWSYVIPHERLWCPHGTTCIAAKSLYLQVHSSHMHNHCWSAGKSTFTFHALDIIFSVNRWLVSLEVTNCSSNIRALFTGITQLILHFNIMWNPYMIPQSGISGKITIT